MFYHISVQIINKNLYIFSFIFLTFGTIAIIKAELDGYKLAYGVVMIMIYGVFYYRYMIQL